jgi:outer membrane protein TolC
MSNYIYILLIFLLATVEVSAQSVKLNSVNDAIQYAFENNPDLEIYNQNQSKAEYDFNSLKNHWLPKISANFSGTNNINLPVTMIPGEAFGQPGKIEAEFGQKYNYSTGISISTSILDFQSKFTAKVAEVSYEIAEANKFVYKQKLAEQVALYYYTAIVTLKALEVNNEDLIAASDALSLVYQKFEQGIIDQYTVNLAKINKNNIYQNINSYNIVLEQCLSNLLILFGLNPKTEITFSESISSKNRKIPAIDYIGPDKNLEVLKLQMKQTDYKISQQRSNWYPQLSLNFYLGAQQYRETFGISFDNKAWSTSSYISLNISIPIFNGFSTKNKVNSALIEHEISLNTLDQNIIQSEIEDDLILKEFNYSKEAVNAAKNNYEIAKENADLHFQKFEEGLVSLNNYLESFDDYLKAEITYLNLLSDSYSYYSKILSRNL